MIIRKYYRYVFVSKSDNLDTMSTFLEGSKFPELIQEEIKKFEQTYSKYLAWICNLKHTHKEKPKPSVFTGEFYEIFKDQIILILHILFKETEEWYTPTIIWGHSLFPETKARKSSHLPISLMNIDTEILNKILTNKVQQHMKKMIPWSTGIYPGMRYCFNIHKAISMIHITILTG